MKTKISYISQYFNLQSEWYTKGIEIDNATESQINELYKLREQALEQSGLTDNELVLIFTCRRYRIFKRVNEYAHKIKRLY